MEISLYFCLVVVVLLTGCIVVLIRINERIKRRYDALCDSFHNLEKLNSELRTQRHDYLNHLQVVYAMMELEEYEELHYYLEPVYRSMMKTGKALKTSIPAVNALLMAKMGEAQEAGIDLYVEVKSDLKGLLVEPWELCKVLANLIDNAMDALKQEDALEREDALEQEDALVKEDVLGQEDALEQENTLMKEDALEQEDTLVKEDAPGQKEAWKREGNLEQRDISKLENVTGQGNIPRPKQKEEKKITVDITEDKESYIFNVTDNGAGIAKEMQEKMFREGVTTKGSGHGMGLFIVGNVLKANRGTIRVVSDERGTQFIVRFGKFSRGK